LHTMHCAVHWQRILLVQVRQHAFYLEDGTEHPVQFIT
jgi:hypothetical protein